MKIIKYIITVLLLLTLYTPTNTNASSFRLTMNAPSTINANQEFSVTVGITEASNISGVSFRLNFNSNHLELKSSSVANSFGSLPSHPNYGIIINPARSGSFSLYTFNFQAKSALSAGTTTSISLENVMGTVFQGGNDIDVSGIGVSRSITVSTPRSTNNNLSAIRVNNQALSNFSANTTTYNLPATDDASINVSATAQDSKATISGTGNVSLSYGSNSIRIVVRAESGATKTYTLNITRNDYRSSNNFLKSMTLSDGTLNFDKNRNNYTIIVDHDVTELTINVEKEDEKASIRDTSITKQLAVYSNLFEFTVVAENNARRTYTVNVVRRDADGYAGSLNTNNRLESLTIEGYEIDFDPDVLKYELFVEHPVSQLEVVALVQDETATLIQPESYQLELGENIFNYTVIAQDETSREYQLIVYRAENLPPLPVEELVLRVDEVEADVLNLKVRRNETISAEHITLLKATGKAVAVHVVDEQDQVIGIWHLSNNQIDLINTFNHGVSLIQRVPASLASLLNYAQSMVVSFNHDGEFNQPLDFTLNLNQTFDDTYLLNVYYFDEVNNRLVLKHENIEIIDDQITWQMDHASIYIVSPATFAAGGWLSFDLNNNLLLGALVILTLSLVANLLLLLKVKKLSRRLLKRKLTIEKSHDHRDRGPSVQSKQTEAFATQTSETMVTSAYDKENQS